MRYYIHTPSLDDAEGQEHATAEAARVAGAKAFCEAITLHADEIWSTPYWLIIQDEAGQVVGRLQANSH